MKFLYIPLLTSLLGLGSPASSEVASPSRVKDRLDVLFINGTVVDGTGAKQYQADVGIAIAESSGVVFDFSQMKITHESYWGRSREVIELIEAAQ